MIPNNSPWIKQLNNMRPISELDKDLETDVVVVGAGIAGILTTYFILRNTNKKVILIEADKIAHGATGHNAGYITAHIEKPIEEMLSEFGEEMTIEGLQLIESSWSLMDDIITETGMQTPLYKTTGYGTYSTPEQVMSVLKENLFRIKNGLRAEDVFISTESELDKVIGEEYKNIYKLTSQENILSVTESSNKDFIAYSSTPEGCMNSALFCEEMVGYMITKFSSRFTVFEKSPMKKVILQKDSGIVKTTYHKIEAKNIVLCTNGFENFNIINEAGDEIDSKFHHSVAGRIGYMAGYLEPQNRSPFAGSYLPKVSKNQDDPTGAAYLYMTRRPFEYEGSTAFNLVCGGGPESVLPNHAVYSKDEIYPNNKKEEMQEMFKEHHKNYRDESETEYAFYWHGLMGYTPNGIRRVGFEPINKVLMYNLGCNGIGIIPSIYGGKRISQLLNGENLKPSIFDPHDPRKNNL